MGFFADVGPLTVFVSHQVRRDSFVVVLHVSNSFAAQLIHPDMKFDPNSNPPSFASEDQVSPDYQIDSRMFNLFSNQRRLSRRIQKSG